MRLQTPIFSWNPNFLPGLYKYDAEIKPRTEAGFMHSHQPQAFVLLLLRLNSFVQSPYTQERLVLHSSPTPCFLLITELISVPLNAANPFMAKTREREADLGCVSLEKQSLLIGF